jgi:hypothetical protein
LILKLPDLNFLPLNFHSQDNLQSRLQTLKTNSVYTSRDQALDDLTRLHKLNDFDGIKLRVLQLFRERSDLETLFSDSLRTLDSFRLEADRRERLCLETRDAARKQLEEASSILNHVK